MTRLETIEKLLLKRRHAEKLSAAKFEFLFKTKRIYDKSMWGRTSVHPDLSARFELINIEDIQELFNNEPGDGDLIFESSTNNIYVWDGLGRKPMQISSGAGQGFWS